MSDSLINYKGEEVKEHGGWFYEYSNNSRGRIPIQINCPFCDELVSGYLWSVSGSGKKCKCGAIIYRQNATKPLKQ